jgi:hypothetical protein
MQKACRHWRQQAFPARGGSATVTRRNAYRKDWIGRGVQDALGDDLSRDAADAVQADRTGRARGEVQYPAVDERAAVVDGDHHAAVAMGDPELGAEWQRAVGTGHGVLIEPLTRSRLAAGFVAVKRGYSGKAMAGRRRWGDRRIGVAPRVMGAPPGDAGVMEMAMAVVMPLGLGRGFGGTPTEHKSCGEHCERRT